MYLLDTSALIDVFMDSPSGKKIRDFIRGKDYYLSSITIYEIGKAKSKKDSMIYFIKNSAVLTLTIEAAEKASKMYKELLEKGQLINEMDLLIAGIATSKNLTVITSDRDFEKLAKYIQEFDVKTF